MDLQGPVRDAPRGFGCEQLGVRALLRMALLASTQPRGRKAKRPGCGQVVGAVCEHPLQALQFGDRTASDPPFLGVGHHCLQGVVVDGDVLVALDRFSVFAVELQELDVDLDLMARHLLLIALGVDLADQCSARQTAQPMALENAIDARIGELYGVIPLQTLDDAHGPKMMAPPQIQDLPDTLGDCATGGVPGDGLAVLQADDAVLPEGIPPAIEAGAADAKIPARLADRPPLIGPSGMDGEALSRSMLIHTPQRCGAFYSWLDITPGGCLTGSAGVLITTRKPELIEVRDAH